MGDTDDSFSLIRFQKLEFFHFFRFSESFELVSLKRLCLDLILLKTEGRDKKKFFWKFLYKIFFPTHKLEVLKC